MAARNEKRTIPRIAKPRPQTDGHGPSQTTDWATPAAVEIAQRPAEELPPLHNGPAAAAILGASFATFVLGALFTVSHSNSALADWLKFREGAGAVSGLSTMATVTWLASWGVLTPVLWNRSVPYVWLAGLSAVLIALGLLFTTPPVVQRINL